MKRSIVVSGGAIIVSLSSIALFNACVNNDFDFNKLKTDEITLFADSLILPLGSTKPILMDEIITEEVLDELGMQKENQGYSFSFKNDNDIDLDFSVPNDIIFDAPVLPSDRLIDPHFGSLTLGDVNLDASLSKTVAEGKIVIVLQPGGNPLAPLDYNYTYQPKEMEVRRSNTAALSLPRMGQSINLLADESIINVHVGPDVVKSELSVNLPSGIPVEKFVSFQINPAGGGGRLSLSINNYNSASAIRNLGSRYNDLRIIFPKEFIVSGNGVLFDTQLNRFVKNFSADGRLDVNLLGVDFGTSGLIPSTVGSTLMTFDFGYQGSFYINTPSTYEEMEALKLESKVQLDIIGSLTQSNITALSGTIKSRSESLSIEDMEIHIGRVEVPSLIQSLSALSIQPVKINLVVGKLSVEGLPASPNIGGTLLLEMPDFCRIENQTIGQDGKWMVAFSNLMSQGFTIPIVIDRFANLPPLAGGSLSFANTKIKVSGSVNIPSFSIENVSAVCSSPLSLKTLYAQGVVNGKMSLNQIEGSVESKGAYKIDLAMLKELREGSGDQSIKLENVSFNNPDLTLNFKHSLPTDFKATMALTPYIADQIKGNPIHLQSPLKGGVNQTTVINGITKEEINGLIAQLPDSVVVSYVVAAGTLALPAVMKVSDLKEITFSALYNVGLPLSFGYGMKISTHGTLDANLGEEFAKMLFSSKQNKVLLAIVAENSIPMNLVVQMIPLDSEGQVIAGITISPFTVGGGTIQNDLPVSRLSKFDVELQGDKEAISKLSKLKYEVFATPSEVHGATIRQDCTLKMSMKLKLYGGVTVAL